MKVDYTLSVLKGTAKLKPTYVKEKTRGKLTFKTKK